MWNDEAVERLLFATEGTAREREKTRNTDERLYPRNSQAAALEVGRGHDRDHRDRRHDEQIVMMMMMMMMTTICFERVPELTVLADCKRHIHLVGTPCSVPKQSRVWLWCTPRPKIK